MIPKRSRMSQRRPVLSYTVLEHFRIVTGSVSFPLSQLRIARRSYDCPSLVTTGSLMNRVVIGQIIARGRPCSSSASSPSASSSASILHKSVSEITSLLLNPLHPFALQPLSKSLLQTGIESAL